MTPTTSLLQLLRLLQALLTLFFFKRTHTQQSGRKGITLLLLSLVRFCSIVASLAPLTLLSHFVLEHNSELLLLGDSISLLALPFIDKPDDDEKREREKKRDNKRVVDFSRRPLIDHREKKEEPSGRRLSSSFTRRSEHQQQQQPATCSLERLIWRKQQSLPISTAAKRTSWSRARAQHRHTHTHTQQKAGATCQPISLPEPSSLRASSAIDSSLSGDASCLWLLVLLVFDKCVRAHLCVCVSCLLLNNED